MAYEIGRVLRASTDGFTCGTRSPEIGRPAFGAFVQTTSTAFDYELTVIGVITQIRIDDDPLIRQLVMAGSMEDAILRDQRENRMVPVEIEVLNVGYLYTTKKSSQIFQSLPPRPPLSLDPVMLCSAEEVIDFTRRLDFLRLIANAGGVPTADLLAASVREATLARAPEDQQEFLVKAGRRLADLMTGNLAMLKHVLTLLNPM